MDGEYNALMSGTACRGSNCVARWIACGGFAFFLLGTAAAGPRVALEKVTIHLFLEKSGEFSPDVTQMAGYVVKNFIPLGDDFPENERVHAFLIKVWFHADGEAFTSGKQARVIIREEKSRRKVFEKVISGVYVGPGGKSAHAILISDRECVPLVVEVRAETSTIKHRLPFHCGE